MLKLTVNDTAREVDADPDMPLLWALRDRLDMTGTKYGCGIAQCGACTVHMDGQPIRSCQTRIGDVGEAKITTIEGVSGRVAEAVQGAWRSLDVVQCGYCQSGQIMSAIGLLSENPKPTEREVREGLEGNLCRCTGYHNIVRAVIAASGQDPDEVQGAAIHRVTDAGGVEAAAGFSSGDSAGGGE